jgi:hypothetical protein
MVMIYWEENILPDPIAAYALNIQNQSWFYWQGRRTSARSIDTAPVARNFYV